MKVLLSGAAGQLGRSLQVTLADHEVVACDHGALDITDFEAVQDATSQARPSLLINAAAYNRVDDAEEDPAPAYAVNKTGPANLARASAQLGIPIVHVSTDYVFSGDLGRAYHELDETNPQSNYGASKLAGEEAVRQANPRHFVVRTAWVYHEEGANFPRTMLGLSDRDEVRVVRDQIGSPTYAPHLATALTELIRTQAFGTYHFAGQGEASWYDLTCALYREMNIATPVIPVTTEEFPRPAKRPPYSALTTTQTPRIVLPPWQEGLAEFCKRV